MLPLKLRNEDEVILENYCQSSGKGLRVSLSLKISFFVADSGAEKGREPLLKGKAVSTIDLHIKLTCFVKNVINIFIKKDPDLDWLVQGGQLYRAFPSLRVP